MASSMSVLLYALHITPITFMYLQRKVSLDFRVWFGLKMCKYVGEYQVEKRCGDECWLVKTPPWCLHPPLIPCWRIFNNDFSIVSSNVILTFYFQQSTNSLWFFQFIHLQHTTRQSVRRETWHCARTPRLLDNYSIETTSFVENSIKSYPWSSASGENSLPFEIFATFVPSLFRIASSSKIVQLLLSPLLFVLITRYLLDRITYVQRQQM